MRAQVRFPSPPPQPGHHPAVVVGGGLVGLTLALDLAQRGVRVVVLDDDDCVSIGSRAICMAKRSLEIFGRLGLGRRMLEKGVQWNTGRVFLRDRELFDFDLLPEAGHEYPAFINLQQYYAEEWLVEACVATDLVDLRWKHAVTHIENRQDGATLQVSTPGGDYELSADWLLACDGANSLVRRAMNLPFTGKIFRDRFLIADIVMQAPLHGADYPSERRFWFDPPFHPNQSALLHKQPDDVWRIDLQLGWDTDPDEERKPERVIPRVQAMLGPDASFELEWVSIYTFRCRRLERFVHGRVVFVGDSAHQVSPFGARGGNGGIQDADNLAWKLAAVLQGQASAALIGTYDDERVPAADENILHSTRATDFITPKTPAARAYRDAALLLAQEHPFARAMVNSGRLSRPCVLPIDADTDDWPGAPPPGSAAIDAPILEDGRQTWLLNRLGHHFTVLVMAGHVPVTHAVPQAPADGVHVVQLSPAQDPTGLVAARYALTEGACILFRPDQHVAGVFHRFDPARIARAIDAAMGARQHAPA